MSGSSAVEVRLLGSPQILRSSEVVAGPRGHKSWAVLARLVLSPRPLPRRELTGLLFSQAEDPLAALRWALSEMRRAMNRDDLLRGDPLVAPPQDELRVDARTLDEPGSAALELARECGELLAGWDFPDCPDFEVWLTNERQRIKAHVEAHLRNAAMAALAAGELDEARALAGRAVASNPLDPALHELLVRAHARAGDRAAAIAQVERCERILQDAFAISAPAAVVSAAEDLPSPPRGAAEVGTPVAVSALLTSGQAAVDAGAIDAGIATLRRASAIAPDDQQRAAALFALGSALVHALRGHDEEGAVHLHEAEQLARRLGDTRTLVAVLRELAFVDVQAGRAATAGPRLDEASALAAHDDGLRCGVLAIQGMHWSDRGDQARAIVSLEASIAAAGRCCDARQSAWSHALHGRSLLLRGDLGAAARALDESIAGCRRERWQAFLPFPLAMRAEVGMASGEPVDDLVPLLEEAFVVGCELGDPCWEGLAGAGLARAAQRTGNHESAWEQALDAHRRCIRHPDRYVFIEAWVLTVLLELAHASDRQADGKRIRSTLRDLVVRTEQPHMQPLEHR